MPVKLTEYCTRGSLGDLLESDDFVLDFDFSLSFISDLIKVSVFANSFVALLVSISLSWIIIVLNICREWHIFMLTSLLQGMAHIHANKLIAGNGTYSC